MLRLESRFNLVVACLLALSVTGCEFLDLRSGRAAPDEFRGALEQQKPPRAPSPQRFEPLPPLVADALLPDLGGGRNRKDAEPRFDISVMQVDAREFFMGLVADSGYNVIVDPGVTGTISISLKNVSLPEVLEGVREVYGYDYKRTAAGYIIYPAELMSRIYHVDYLNVVRSGRSETRVSSGPSSLAYGMGVSGGINYGQGGQYPYAGAAAMQAPVTGVAGGDIDEAIDCRDFKQGGDAQAPRRSSGSSYGGLSSRQSNLPGSVVSTTSTSHFWREMKEALGVIVCTAEGANFVVNPQSGVVVVRAFPKQLRDVERFLEAMRREVQRQVVLEARILEVELKDGYQAGVDWASLIRTGKQALLTSLTGPIGEAASTQTLGSVFTIGVGKGDFKAFIELLETQGNVNTLSSPRISTVNNQKAVIKVGADELHVSNVNPGSFASGTIVGVGFAPSPVLSPFFSGIALDVTPQIDDGGKVTLHIHPSVTDVTDKMTTLNFGNGEQSIPLAFSQVRESDSVVHAQNGQIVVIGGLMKNQENNTRQGVAWLSRIPVLGSLFRRGTGDFRKSELVILLKPTIIEEPGDWNGVREEVGDRYEQLDSDSRREILP